MTTPAKPRDWDKEKPQLKRYIKDGVAPYKIAAFYNVKTAYLKLILFRLGLGPNPKETWISESNEPLPKSREDVTPYLEPDDARWHMTMKGVDYAN